MAASDNSVNLADITGTMPAVWGNLLYQQSTELFTLFNNTVAYDGEMAAYASTGNMGIATVPFLNALSGATFTKSSDDPTDIITSNAPQSNGKMYYTVFSENIQFSQMDYVLQRLQAEYRGSRDLLSILMNREIGPAWRTLWQNYVVSILKGVTATNIASYSSDAFYDISNGTPSVSFPAYDSYILSPGAVRFGMGTVEMPMEFDRVPGAGGGSGQTKAISRARWAMHPTGYSYALTTDNPTAAQLENAATWTRPWSKELAQRFITFRCNADIDTGGTPVTDATNCPNPQAIARALQKMGEYKFDRFSVWLMHSEMHRYLSELNLISTIQYSTQDGLLRQGAYYEPAQLRIIVADKCPVYTA